MPLCVYKHTGLVLNVPPDFKGQGKCQYPAPLTSAVYD